MDKQTYDKGPAPYFQGVARGHTLMSQAPLTTNGELNAVRAALEQAQGTLHAIPPTGTDDRAVHDLLIDGPGG